MQFNLFLNKLNDKFKSELTNSLFKKSDFTAEGKFNVVFVQVESVFANNFTGNERL